MGFFREFYGILLGFLCGIPVLFHVNSMIFIWDFCEIPEDFYDISMGLLWGAN